MYISEGAGGGGGGGFKKKKTKGEKSISQQNYQMAIWRVLDARGSDEGTSTENDGALSVEGRELAAGG